MKEINLTSQTIGSWTHLSGFNNFDIILLFILVISAFFFRGFQPEIIPVSTSFLIPIITILLAVSILASRRKQRIAFPRPILIMFFALLCISAISILGNLFVYDGGVPVLHFAVELFLNFTLFVVVFIWAKDIDLSFLINSIFVVGTGFAIYIFYIAIFELDTIRRVGNIELPIGVNHLSHALAVAVIIGVCHLLYRDNRRVLTLISVVIIGAAMVLTGSRSGLAALLLAGLALAFIEGPRKFAKISLYVGGAGAIAMILVSALFDFTGSGGFHRFTIDALVSTLSARLETQVDFLRSVFTTFTSSSIGNGMDEYPLVSSEGGGDPHNKWVSFAVFTGVPAAIAFTLLHLHITLQGFRSALREPQKRATLVPLVLMLVITSVYAFFSGRLTRIFTIWIAMGLVLAALHVNQSDASE